MSCESYPNVCIIQGQTYRQIFTAEGNWSGAECRGQIRDNWLNSDGAIKAIFEFGALTYDAETDLTTVEGVVSHQQTTLLPATKYQGVGTQSVRNSLVYDVEFELDGNVFKLAPGYVQIIPEVSDDSVIYDPPIVWDGGINSVELTETNGLVDTYTIWGDAAKTINLGTFDVRNSEGVGIESANYDNSTGVLTFIYTDGSEFSTEDIRGEQGNDGVGIQSTEYDPLTGILTFTFTDNSEFSTGDLRADLDAATIKTRYELNEDTNAFTDAEKTKLAGITAGAEVNVNADWNAVSGDSQILNKPTLGTAAATDSTDYATTAQGTLADSALQPGTIGVTVQPYNANTVIDANYVATENSYTTTEKNKLAGIEAGATADQTGAEIKTLYEAEADTNVYTDAEKTKLAGIASGAEVNVQSDWNAVIGDAFILNKPSTFPPSSHTQTASTITDFDTEVSNNSDVAANTSARHVAVTVVDSSEIDLTLTGQQISASLVAGSIDETKLDTSVNASLNLADSALQPGTIGVTVQGYNANTVIDSAYVHTDNNYTTTEKNKLAGIADGAEVNVNADWNAVSGDAQILNKPTLGTAAATDSTDYATAAQGALADTALQPDQAETISGDYSFNGALILPNNSRINGVEHFYQTSKPTVRGDSSALVAGDRWWKTDDGTEWFWNGTYWLSNHLYECAVIYSAGAPIGGVTTVWAQPFSFPDKPIYITRQFHFTRFVPSVAGDGWATEIRFSTGGDASSIPSLPALEILAPNTTTYTYKLFGEINSFYDLPANGINITKGILFKIGTPTPWHGSAGFNYRIVTQ